MASQLQIFTLTGNPQLAEEIAEEIGIPLSPCSVKRFADGETMVDIKESVRGNHVYIVQPTCAPVNERLMELLIMIDALKRASAKTINVVTFRFLYKKSVELFTSPTFFCFLNFHRLHIKQHLL